MTREIKIRTVPNLTFSQLKLICEKYEFPSFNQFMLDQLQNIVNNDWLNLYQNQFSKTLSEIKFQQKEILDQLLKNEIRQISLDAKQEVVEKLTTDWLRFIDDLDALETEK